MSHRLLILGSLGEFTELVKKAKSRGIYTIVCDGYPDGPARAYADETHTIPVTNIDAIATLCKERTVDGIITSFSDLLLECMVKIADKAGIPCYLKPSQLTWYRDKSATKALLARLGLPTPSFQKIPVNILQKEKQLSPALLYGLNFPLITKPMDKYGSRGIQVSHTLAELTVAAKEAADFTDLDEILVEEYNNGCEFNMMTWVMDGKVHIISIADREKTAIPDSTLPQSTRNVYPSCLYDQVAGPAQNLLQRFVEETGQTEGALSMQFFWSKESGIQVCEIAARFFGYEHELTDIVFDFNIEDLLLDYLYDKKSLKKRLLAHNPQKPRQHGAVLYFHGRLKEIADLSAAKRLGKHPNVVKPWFFYRAGEKVIAHGPNPYFALYYIAAPSRLELDAVTEYFFDEMQIPDSEGKELLYKNRIPDYS